MAGENDKLKSVLDDQKTREQALDFVSGELPNDMAQHALSTGNQPQGAFLRLLLSLAFEALKRFVNQEQPTPTPTQPKSTTFKS